MSKLTEEWKTVVGYEGLYEVSDWGNVRSLNYNKTKKPKNLKLVENRYGYLVVCLHKDGKQKEGKVHRLVAEAFIPNPQNKLEVGHTKTMENGLEDKTANEAWNLQWMTREENANFGTIGHRIAKRMIGDKNPMKREDVALKVAEKQKESGKRRWLENPESLKSFLESNKHNEKKKIKINQYTKSSEFIRTWDSAADVEKELRIHHTNISACCKGKVKSAGGYKWKYYEN